MVEMMRRSQRLLVAMSAAAVAIGAVSKTDWGDLLIVYGVCGIFGGVLFGLIPISLLSSRNPQRRFLVWYSVIGVIGIVSYTVFLVMRPRVDAADIGFGFIPILGASLGLPGIVGTAVAVLAGDARSEP